MHANAHKIPFSLDQITTLTRFKEHFFNASLTLDRLNKFPSDFLLLLYLIYKQENSSKARNVPAF